MNQEKPASLRKDNPVQPPPLNESTGQVAGKTLTRAAVYQCIKLEP